MKKLIINAVIYLSLIAFSVTATAIYYKRALVQQGIFMHESNRLEAINIASDLYWFPKDSFRDKLICNVYKKDKSFRNMTKSYGEKFLRSSGVHTELRSHAQHIYDLFEISRNEVDQMCRK